MASILPGKPKIRVGAMLALLAALPLIGLSIFAYSQFSEVRSGQAELSAIEVTSQDLNILIELEAAVDTEIYWTEANRTIDDFGVPPSLVMGLLGLDAVAEQPLAQAEVDRLLAAYDDPQLTRAIDEARANPDARTLTHSALAIASEQEIMERIWHASNELQIRSAAIPDGEELARRAQVLNEANNLRSQFSTVIGAYLFGLIASNDNELRAFSDTVSALATYNQVSAELSATLQLVDNTETALENLRQDPDVSRILEQARSGTLDLSMGDEEPSLIDPSTFQTLAESFGRATAGSERHLELVGIATTEFNAELAATQARELREARIHETVTVATIVATLIALVAATRAIVRPIRRLGAAAEALGVGTVEQPLELSGPVEIQAATFTLNQAASNLQRAEAQAHALADGRLEDASFTDAAPGPLGQSLDAAVRRLKDSMTEREQFRQQLSHEAAHDGLTGISNRSASITALENALSRAEGSGEQLAVLFIDLDGFKRINDIHGHEAGDHLLIRVAQRLLASCRPNDRVGRLGGDEFLVVAEPVSGLGEARRVAERLRQAASGPVHYRGLTLQASLSIGVAVTDGLAEADEVIREADYAVYQAKKTGRSKTYCFDDALRSQLRQEADLEEAIKTGLAEDQFSLHFQPILCAFEHTVRKFEALLRWERPSIGDMPPDSFIPFAERSDLIIEIDRWVINEGIKHLALFGDRPETAEIAIGVNVSGRHLSRGDLVHHVAQTLQRWDVDPRRFAIEVTEGALLDDLGAAADTLAGLRQLGVQVAIDDFGTGYTSLTHLRHLPADVLKIDKSFVHNADEGDLSLVRLITETGHLLGMEITVEGVETIEQRDQLRALGVDSLQGYLFGRPKRFNLNDPVFRSASLAAPNSAPLA